MKPVSAPLSSTRLSRLIYLLALITTALAAYYSWRVMQWKTEVGGWWNLALGVPPKSHTEKGQGSSESGSDTVEAHIIALALSLGVPAPDLAKAIAGAVRAYVPPASLSSVSESARATDGKLSPVLEELLRQSGADEQVDVNADSTATPGVVESVIGGFVGMDEP